MLFRSTLVKQVSQKLNIPMFNASDLISEINNEDYSKFKNVSDKVRNQNILIKQVEMKLEAHDKILLTGHCCIMTKEMRVEKLPISVFDELHISKFILIEADVNTISELLYERDSIKYSCDFLDDFVKLEHEYSIHITNKYSIPHYKVFNDFSDGIIDELISILEGV